MTAIAASAETRDRAIEFGAAAALHVALIAGLSLVLLTPPKPPPPPASMDVTIAEDVGLTASAPQSETPPAQSQAPDLGPPEDAAPSAPSAEPEPAPAKPQPAPPAPAPKAVEVAKPQPVKKVAPAPSQPAKPQVRPAPSGALAGIVGRGNGTTPGAKAAQARGERLGDVVKSLGDTPSRSPAPPQGRAMSQQAAMDIGSKIKQQVEPCARNQTSPGPGAGRIVVSLRLRFASDGSLSTRPTVEGHTGVDDENGRYVRQVDDRAISAFMACQPLRGLPAQYYDVPGGWANFVLRYRFSGWGS